MKRCQHNLGVARLFIGGSKLSTESQATRLQKYSLPEKLKFLRQLVKATVFEVTLEGKPNCTKMVNYPLIQIGVNHFFYLQHISQTLLEKQIFSTIVRFSDYYSNIHYQVHYMEMAILYWHTLSIPSAICGLYYKHVQIVNYASSGVNELKTSLNDDARVVIYDRHMFIVQATVLAFPPICHFMNEAIMSIGFFFALVSSELNNFFAHQTKLSPGANVIKLYTAVIFVIRQTGNPSQPSLLMFAGKTG